MRAGPLYLGMCKQIISTWALTALCLAAAILMQGCRGPKLSVADEQMARGEYFDASRTYRKIYNKTGREDKLLRASIAFKMAECHSRLSQNARAAAAYQNAIRYGYPDSTAILNMARSLHADGKYAAALKAYDEFLALAPKMPRHDRVATGHLWPLKPRDARVAILCATQSFSTPVDPTSRRCFQAIYCISPPPTRR